MAQEYDDLATDLETGAVEIRHPELLSERQRSRGRVNWTRPGLKSDQHNTDNEQ